MVFRLVPNQSSGFKERYISEYLRQIYMCNSIIKTACAEFQIAVSKLILELSRARPSLVLFMYIYICINDLFKSCPKLEINPSC